MAKRSGGPNKSAAIRDYLQTNADAKPKEIVEHLQSQGMDVTPAFVSTIKSKLLSSGQISGGTSSGSSTAAAPAATKRRGRPKGVGRKKMTRRGAAPVSEGASASAAPAGRAAAASGNVSIDGLVLAKKLVDQLGGVDKARAALSALEKITG